MKTEKPEAPKGFRWVRRGEWLRSTDSCETEDNGWCRPSDSHNWVPHKCRTSYAYIRSVKR